MVTMRVVSTVPDTELTLVADKPTTMYITTRLSGVDGGHTRVARSFLWDEPADPEIAEGLRGMMGAMVAAGETAIQEVFAEGARTAS